MPNKYTYPNSEVLRNKFGLTDSVAAHTMETRLTYIRAAELLRSPVAGKFDERHLLEIHRRLFQDMYEWAGRPRDVPTYTTNTQLVHCLPEFLKDESDRVFRDLQRDNVLQGMNDNDFNDRLAYHWGELTALHVSLNGNTRSQRVFVDQLTRESGRSIDWAAVNRNIEPFKVARLYAHAGNHVPLREQLNQVVRPTAGTTTGPELAGPAVDPKVTKAALSGLALPGTSSGSASGLGTKDTKWKARGRDGQDLG
ncbi:MAG TPA: Fic family protein [Kribbella sp.]|nr:Fic family protein [Kribbella sp.]